MPLAGVGTSEFDLSENAAHDFNDFVLRFLPAASKFQTNTTATAGRKLEAGRGLSLAAAKASNVSKLRSPIKRARAVGSRARAIAQGDAIAREGAVQAERKGLQKLVAFGRGLSFDANVGLGQAATRAANATIQDANRRTQAGIDNLSGLATAAGAFVSGATLRSSKKGGT